MGGGSRRPGSATGAIFQNNRWTIVGVLCALYVMSALDRVILALLVKPIQAALFLDDAALGALFGLGFGVVFAVAGLPVAYLVDRGNRMRLVFIGVWLWSLCTIASAFATNLTYLVLFRSGLAIGEAVLVQAAASLIADLFVPAERAKPISMFAMTGVIMGTGAFVLGSGAISLATYLASTFDMEPWRLTLLLVGIPAPLIVTTLYWRTPEPSPQSPLKTSGSGSGFLSHLMKERAVYAPVIAASVLALFVQAALIAWVPAMLVREQQMTEAGAGLFFGVIGALASLFGTVVAPWQAERWRKRGYPSALSIVMVVLAMIEAAALFLLLRTGSTPLVCLGLFIGIFCTTGTCVLPAVLFQQITPARMQGRLFAVNLLFSSILGFGLGPWVVGALSQMWGGSNGLSASLSVVGLVAPLCLIVPILLARSHIAARTARIESHPVM